MTIHSAEKRRQTSINHVLRVILSRIAGLCLFAMGIFYWSRLIGAGGVPEWRFDLMPVWWRISAPVLAVLYPVAGAGVWMLASWGVVIWILVFLIEGVMRLGFPDLFGFEPVLLTLHIVGLALLAILRVMIFAEQRRGLR